MYILKLAFRPCKWAPLSQLFAVLTASFLLFLMGFLIWLGLALDPVVAHINRSQVITAYLDSKVSDAKIDDMMDEIRLTLSSSSENLHEVKWVGPEDFLSELSRVQPALSRELLNLGSDMDLVVPRYITVTGVLVEQALDHIRKMEGISLAESSAHRFKETVGAFVTLQWITRLLVVGLLIALVTGLIQISRMNAHLQSDTVALLRLWGADGFKLLIPGAVSGILIGLTGGFFSFLAWVLSHGWIGSHVNQLSPVFQEMPPPVSGLGWLLLLVGLGAGVISGFLGGFMGAMRGVANCRR